MGGLRKVLIYKYATFSHVTVFEHACFTGHHTWYEPPVSPQILCPQGAVSYLGVFFTECTRAPPPVLVALSLRSGPGFFVCFLPVSTPELRSAELSTSLQISFFLFLCELSSP